MATERKFVTENIKRVLLKEYMLRQLDRAGFGGLDIQRTPMGTRVTLITERPGLVIGRRGAAIKALTKAIEEDFNFSNPQIEVQQENNPSLNAQIMSEKLATALERGWHFRRAGHSIVRRIMDSGAKGCQVILAGKLTGQRHRTEKFREGHIKYCGDPKIKFMREGFCAAKLKPGIIGVKVWIMDPTARLPDEVIITATPTATAELLEAGSPGELSKKEELSISASAEEAAAEKPVEEAPAQDTSAEPAQATDEAPEENAEPSEDEKKADDEQKKEDA
ncbi:MAG: 30S ribosomal protein S3 [Thermoplasmata archaeon]|nr:30S ribosomal protein S3 [Thermoplasmata archaeon]